MFKGVKSHNSSDFWSVWSQTHHNLRRRRSPLITRRSGGAGTSSDTNGLRQHQCAESSSEEMKEWNADDLHSQTWVCRSAGVGSNEKRKSHEQNFLQVQCNITGNIHTRTMYLCEATKSVLVCLHRTQVSEIIPWLSKQLACDNNTVPLSLAILLFGWTALCNSCHSSWTPGINAHPVVSTVFYGIFCQSNRGCMANNSWVLRSPLFCYNLPALRKVKHKWWHLFQTKSCDKLIWFVNAAESKTDIFCFSRPLWRFSRKTKILSVSINEKVGNVFCWLFTRTRQISHALRINWAQRIPRSSHDQNR